MTQKNITIITLCSVVLGAVLVNEMIMRSQNQDQNREIASFGERFAPNQIKWEHELAKNISTDVKSQTLIGKKPNLQDRLLFEVFAGHYEARLDQGKIQKISLLQNQTPLQVDTETFLKEYASVMKAFDEYTITKSDSNLESVILKGKEGREVGKLLLQRDDQGRVLSIEVQ